MLFTTSAISQTLAVASHDSPRKRRACMTLVADRLDGKVLLRVLGKLLTLIDSSSVDLQAALFAG